MFDSSLANYALETFRRDGIKVKTSHHIEELRRGLPGTVEGDDRCLTLKTKEDGEVGIGMCVWSTGQPVPHHITHKLISRKGLMMNPFIQKALADIHTYPLSSARLSYPPPSDPSSLKWALKRHPKTGGLMVDDRFRVKIIPQPSTNSSSPRDASASSPKTEAIINDVFALGDVAVMEKSMLPATAQVANQESKWLAKRLNNGDLESQAFTFKSLGIMTYIGSMRAIMQTGGANEIKGCVLFISFEGRGLLFAMELYGRSWMLIHWLTYFWIADARLG
jgi:NADH dehydrogenase FAD-containing subunit